MAQLTSVIVLAAFVHGMAYAFLPSFSAFSQNGVLYVTVLGDQCNEYAAGLQVAPDCDKDRLNKNFALECEAELVVYQTLRDCQPDVLKPQTFELELEATKVAPEARTLILHYQDEVQEVELN